VVTVVCGERDDLDLAVRRRALWWRGALARTFDRWPRLALRAAAPVLAYGRVQQRAFKRKVDAGRWPPRGATSPVPRSARA